MGNCVGEDRKPLPTAVDHKDLDNHPQLSFDEIFERNLVAIQALQKVQTKEKTFADFIKRKTKINVERANGKLSISTLRLLNRYRDEWVFIQMEEKWAKVLKERRDNVGNPKKYKEIYEKDMKEYNDNLAKAQTELLKEHAISQSEYDEASTANLSLALENQVSDTVWTYWAFKDASAPKKLEKADLLAAVKALTAQAKKSSKQLKELLPAFPAEPTQADTELAMTWLGESGALKVRFEDFYLAQLDKRFQSDPEIAAASMSLGMAIAMSGMPPEMAAMMQGLGGLGAMLGASS